MLSPRTALVLLLLAGLAIGGCGRQYGPRTDTASSRVVHTVGQGETLGSIAALYGVDQRAIIDANRLDGTGLLYGQQLIIPGGKPLPTPASPVVAAPPAAPKAPAQPELGSDWYIPRSAWATEDIIQSRINPMEGKPIRITVHHTDMPGDTTNAPEDTLRKIDIQHRKQIGRKGEPGACIGYHFLISRDGRVFEGRPLKYRGAHAGGDNNERNIGVCLLGNFQDHQVPAAQRDKLIQVLDRLRTTYGIPRDQVMGHRDFNPPGNHHTDCPGTYLYRIVLDYQQGNLGSDVASTTPKAAALHKN
jgi:hypothetical protein